MIAFTYMYQLAKFGDLMSYGSKYLLHPASSTNTHHDVTDLVKYGITKNVKT